MENSICFVVFFLESFTYHLLMESFESKKVSSVHSGNSQSKVCQNSVRSYSEVSQKYCQSYVGKQASKTKFTCSSYFAFFLFLVLPISAELQSPPCQSVMMMMDLNHLGYLSKYFCPYLSKYFCQKLCKYFCLKLCKYCWS